MEYSASDFKLISTHQNKYILFLLLAGKGSFTQENLAKANAESSLSKLNSTRYVSRDFWHFYYLKVNFYLISSGWKTPPFLIVIQ